MTGLYITGVTERFVDGDSKIVPGTDAFVGEMVDLIDAAKGSLLNDGDNDIR